MTSWASGHRLSVCCLKSAICWLVCGFCLCLVLLFKADRHVFEGKGKESTLGHWLWAAVFRASRAASRCSTPMTHSESETRPGARTCRDRHWGPGLPRGPPTDCPTAVGTEGTRPGPGTRQQVLCGVDALLRALEAFSVELGDGGVGGWRVSNFLSYRGCWDSGVGSGWGVAPQALWGDAVPLTPLKNQPPILHCPLPPAWFSSSGSGWTGLSPLRSLSSKSSVQSRAHTPTKA